MTSGAISMTKAAGMAGKAGDGTVPGLRRDLQEVAAMIAPGSRVLDVGCADGALLAHLMRDKRVDGRGLELSQRGVNHCVSAGLSVIQGDADTDLIDYPADAFDYVILSQTIQATRDPKAVLQQMMRIGRYGIVSLPNFGHWRVRWTLGWGGRMPLTAALEHQWYETPNIHLCTVRDFVMLSAAVGARVERSLALTSDGRRLPVRSVWLANLVAEVGVFLLTRAGDRDR